LAEEEKVKLEEEERKKLLEDVENLKKQIEGIG
jgi:hypothetical protein